MGKPSLEVNMNDHFPQCLQLSTQTFEPQGLAPESSSEHPRSGLLQRLAQRQRVGVVPAAGNGERQESDRDWSVPTTPERVRTGLERSRVAAVPGSGLSISRGRG